MAFLVEKRQGLVNDENTYDDSEWWWYSPVRLVVPLK
jgi:hypothetical protein